MPANCLEKTKKFIKKLHKAPLRGEKSDQPTADSHDDVTKPCFWLDFSLSANADSLARLLYERPPKMLFQMGSDL